MADDRKERYINPYTDFGFKKLFGSEMNKDLLISFLIAQYSEAERRQFEASQKEYWDFTSTMDTAYMKGEQKGLEKGREEEKFSMARRMKADGLPIETIAKYTGLTVDEVNAL